MSLRSWLLARLRPNKELRGLASDSVHVGVWQGSTAAAELLQIVLITHALGLAQYGTLALVIAFATLISQMLDVKVGTAATIFAGRELLNRSSERTAGILQFSFLVDAVTGMVGFVVLVIAASLFGSGVVGGAGLELVILYGLVLLASTVDASSLTVLRLLDRFRLVAFSTLLLEGLRIALVALALAVYGSLTSVVVAILAAKLITAVVYLTIAALTFRRVQGRRLMRPALSNVRTERRAILSMIVHTSVVSYGRITQVQLPTLLLGGFSGPTQVGIYKVGMAAAASVGKLSDTAYASFLPRFTRLWASDQAAARRLIHQSSRIAIPAMTFILTVVILLRDPILQVLGGGPEAAAAGGVLILGAIGQAINGALFWNIGVLFVAQRSAIVSRISIGIAIGQLALLPPLILAFDATGAALTVCLSSVVANAVTTVLAQKALRAAPRAKTASAATVEDAMVGGR